MHAARLQTKSEGQQNDAANLDRYAYVGCSGWFYWKWRGLFYPEGLPNKRMV